MLLSLRSPVPGYVAPFIYDNDLGSGWGWMPYKSKNTIVSATQLPGAARRACKIRKTISAVLRERGAASVGRSAHPCPCCVPYVCLCMHEPTPLPWCCVARLPLTLPKGGEVLVILTSPQPRQVVHREHSVLTRVACCCCRSALPVRAARAAPQPA